MSISHGAADTETTSRLNPALESRVEGIVLGPIPETTEDLSVGQDFILGINGQVTFLRGCHPGGLADQDDRLWGK